jgi:hypothetical protein
MDLNQAMELNQQLTQIVATLEQLRTGVTQAKTAGQEEFERKREVFYQQHRAAEDLFSR